MMLVLTVAIGLFVSAGAYGNRMQDVEVQDDGTQELDSVSYERAMGCYNLYMEGVESQSRGDNEKAAECFGRYLSTDGRPDALQDIEIDLLARCIGLASGKDDWENVVRYGAMATGMDRAVVERYGNTPWIYLMYVSGLNILNKSEGVDRIVSDGLYYVDRQYAPTQPEYYSLRLQGVVTDLNANRKEKAVEALDRIEAINAKEGNHVADAAIERVRRHIREYSDMPGYPFRERGEFIEQYGDYAVRAMMAGTGMGEEEREKLWGQIFNLGQNFLNEIYFDAYNADDEVQWRKFLSWHTLAIPGFMNGQGVATTAGCIYDCALTLKNFLNWHSSNLRRKKEMRWGDIAGSLDKDEIAVEVLPNFQAAVVVRSGSVMPEMVELDSVALAEAGRFDRSEPLGINEFYSSGSPLVKLLKQLGPHFAGCKRIYVSGSSELAAVNWGALPYRDGTLDDAMEVVPMITTADIPELKTRRDNRPIREVSLFGGMNYGDFRQENRRTGEYSGDGSLRQENRRTGGYRELPFTGAEVDSVAEICRRFGVECHVYKGDEAEESVIKRGEYRYPSVLHIATHSHLPDDGPVGKDGNGMSTLGVALENTGLMFSGCNAAAGDDDGMLRAMEIAGMDLSGVRLAVLSSCSSGLGDNKGITGVVYGLTNALKSSGVESILVTLWDMPDYTTSVFMKSFYENMLGGKSTRESLLAARRELMGRGYDDPYYWAGFMVLE